MALSVITLHPGQAAPPRALPTGGVPDDRRLAPPKDLDGYFPFAVPSSRESWDQRAAVVRRQILVSQGLWPMPTRGALNPVIHGKVDRGDYTVEKVYFESFPGFHVTGNLYRPKNVTGRVPGVLFAHGHWTDARLSESSEAELRGEIATGQERFEEGGRSRFQSMCVQLARMGCVVWQWDMLGNSDAQQLSMQLVHGFAKQRPDMNAPGAWGFFSPLAESHLQSVMGLQTLNSVRSLDFLLSLPEVDPERIAMTGASGGGTQTMILAAIDPRVKLSFPAVMVSTAMQGGCTCENASLLRVDTGNVEFAALFAPGPQGMTTANDWTKEMATKGFPELKQLYTLLGAADRVTLHRGEHFPHNYNAVSRSAFYGVLNRHFKLGQKEPVLERDYPRLNKSELTVYDDAHPRPAGGEDFERNLLQALTKDAAAQLAAAARTEEGRRTVIRPAIETVLGRTLAEVGTVEWEMTGKTDRGQHLEMVGLLRNRARGESLPAIFLHPKDWKGTTVLVPTPSGKAGLFLEDGSPIPSVRRHLEEGSSVVGLDLIYQGEFLADGKPIEKTARVKNPREAAAYTFGYNRTVFQQRVHDLLTAIAFVKNHERASKHIVLAPLTGAGPWAACAQVLAEGVVDGAPLDAGSFRFAGVRDIHSPDFTPGGAKYLDPFVLERTR
jgi:dienelactone hydrolase